MTYSQGNRLSTFNGQNVIYDTDGNMTTGPLKGNTATYSYDARNRLTAAGNITYLYDAENNRIGVNETVYGQVYSTRYVVNPNSYLSQVLIKTDNQGNKTYYVYGLGLIGQEDPDGTYRTYHFDRRGSTVALTDENGSVTDRFQYASYGELVYRTGTIFTPFLYNGRDGVMSDSNGLYFMRARYYNPEIKRFINQDVILGSIDKGQSLNRHAYVNGNPISYVDPFGLSRDSDNLFFIGAIGLAADDFSGIGVTDDVLIPFLFGAYLFSSQYTETFEMPWSNNDMDAYYASGEYKEPKPGVSGKEGAKDVPSWAKGNRPFVGEKGNDFAERLCDEKYGKGNYPKGPNSEYNKIRKWGDRAFE